MADTAAAEMQAEHDKAVLQLVQDAVAARPQVAASREFKQATKDQAVYQQAPPGGAADGGAADGAAFTEQPAAPPLAHVHDRWHTKGCSSMCAGGAGTTVAAPPPAPAAVTIVRVKRKRDELPTEVLYLENAQKSRAKRANVRSLVSSMQSASLTSGAGAAAGAAVQLRRVGEAGAAACRGADGGAAAVLEGDGAARPQQQQQQQQRVTRKAKRPTKRSVKAGAPAITAAEKAAAVARSTAEASVARAALARQRLLSSKRELRVVELGSVASTVGEAVPAPVRAPPGEGAVGGRSPAKLIRGPSELDFLLPQAWAHGKIVAFERVMQLMAGGEPIDFQSREWGRTALMAAAKHGHGTMVRELLRRRADVSVVDERGATALDHAEVALRGGVPGAEDALEQLRQATIMKDAMAMAMGGAGGAATAATDAPADGAVQDDIDDESTYVYDFYTVVAPSDEPKAAGEASEAVVQPPRQLVKMSQLFYLDGSSAAGDVLFDFGDEDEDDEDFGEDDYDSNAEDNPANDYGDGDEDREAEYYDLRDGCSDDSEARLEEDDGDY